MDSSAPLIAQFADRETLQGLALAEIAQALDGGGHRWGRLAGGGHEQGDGAAVASDGDLLTGAHGIKQSRQVGFGLEGADTAHEVKTSHLVWRPGLWISDCLHQIADSRKATGS